MERIRWERLAAILICGAFGIALGYLFLRVLFPILLPILIALGISCLVRPAARAMRKRLGGSVKLWAAVLLASFLLALGFGTWWGIRRLYGELRDLAQRLMEANGGEEAFSVMEQIRKGILGFLPNGGEHATSLHVKVEEIVNTLIEKAISAVTEYIPRLMGNVLSALPNLAFAFIVTVLCGFYFCFDGESIARSCNEILPTSLQKKLPLWSRRFKNVSFRYLRAYLWLLLLTVGELFIGFLILRVRYAFLLAIGIAVLDMLPVLGVGTVLLPWAAVAFLQRDFYLGFGLLILYTAVLLLRQISEPRLIGKSLGVHPLLTLIATYIGFRCFGFLGMLLAPFAALLIKSLILQFRQMKRETK